MVQYFVSPRLKKDQMQEKDKQEVTKYTRGKHLPLHVYWSFNAVHFFWSAV